MAMSLKKIGAIAIGGAMVATTLASGAMAATTAGDVEGFMDKVVKDGQPNVEIVVGSDAAAMDVVSASDIAAKIGSMCYKEGAVEDGSVDLSITVSADSVLSENFKNDSKYPIGKTFLVFTTPKRKYTNSLGYDHKLKELVNENDINRTEKLARLSTLVRDTDADPDGIKYDKPDAIEFLLAAVKKVDDSGDTCYEIGKKNLVYGSLIFKNKGKYVNELIPLRAGMEVPLLGETYRVLKIDKDKDKIYLGKEVFSKILEEGTVHDIGNGYQVRVVKVLARVQSNKPTVYVEILKDGKVVESKNDFADNGDGFDLIYKDIGVYVYDAYRDIPSQRGYASVLATKDVKSYKLGKEFNGSWKIYGITRSGSALETTDDGDDPICGLALRYEGDKIDDLSKGDTVDFANDYAMLEFTDDGEEDDAILYLRYKMDESKDLTLGIGDDIDILNTYLELKNIKAVAQEVVPVKAPIAKLDTEVSLDSNKNMILVGGPVANKLTRELQEKGKVNIDNDSPATIQVVDGNILVVAGGDRDKTREAAKYLIENY